MRIRTVPSGESFITYDNFDYLTNGELVDINVNNILFIEGQYNVIINLIAGLPDLSGVYTKAQVDALLLTKADLVDFEELKIQVETLNEDVLILQSETEALTAQVNLNVGYITENSTNITNNTASILANQAAIDFNEENIAINRDLINVNTSNIATNTTNITNNSASISTLNTLIQQSFSTFGSYISPKGSATDEIIRPVLTEVIALDSSYVEVDVSPEPNEFLNKKEGKVIFTITLSNLSNEGVGDATLGLNIYVNDILVASPSTIIEEGWVGSRPVTGSLNVLENDIVYIEYDVVGSLSVDSPIQYNINYASDALVASPSSQILNDKITNPTSGINTDLNQVTTNTTNITNLANQISALQTQINNNLLAVGTILISTQVPGYGTWTYLGTLGTGQTIIGGVNSNGSVISHNHTITYNGSADGFSRKYWDSISDGGSGALGRGADDSGDGNIYAEIASRLVTNNSGADKNYPYGFGIGVVNIYRRDA